ncbi:MAG: NAD(P)H-dependent oxidoreductase [Patiriisocius sp.]|uniref:NAD(P)H-dependent oxidoreductase n=1 Tax=Patiriisocius sp. TaxID=2822396 RepID=UPI003EF2CBF1
MSFLQSMQKRYTTKKYKSEKKLSDIQLEELKQILRLTPSSINSQPWKFTFVSDSEIKQKLSKVSKMNTQKVIDCDTVIVFSRIDDLDIFENQIQRELPQGAVDYFRDKVRSKSDAETKKWMDNQVYIALGILLSACAEMGIDSTPMEGIEPEEYNRILNNKNHHVLAAVAVGYRDEDDANQPSKKPKSRRTLSDVIEVI